MPMYCYSCPTCETNFDEIQDYDNRDNCLCPDCGGQTNRLITPPNVMRVSYPDGKRRFQDIKTAHQLKKLRANAKEKRDFAEEKRLKQEIKKVEKKT